MGSLLLTKQKNNSLACNVVCRRLHRYVMILIMKLVVIDLHTDSLHEGYSYLRAVVMAYGDITPESPLSLTSGSQQTTQQTTSVSTSERTTPQPNTGTHTPSTLDPFERTGGNDFQVLDKEVLQNIRNVAKSWSRPHSSLSNSEPADSRPLSGSDIQRRHGSRTPVSA